MSSPQFYEKNGFKMFACHRDKKPKLFRGESWQDPEKHVSVGTAEAMMIRGEYVGAWIPSDIIVIDIDTHDGKTSGFDTLKTVCTRIGFNRNLWDITFSVSTPSGGMHCYFYYPDDKIRQCQPEGVNTGIDIKTNSGYVIAGFSEGYKPLNNLDIADLPDELKTWLEHTVNDYAGTHEVECENKKISLETFQRCLDSIDPRDFNSDQTWVNFAMSCVSAIGGDPDGKKMILDWGSRDPRYNTNEHIRNNITRINSFTPDSDKSDGIRKIGVGTFIKILQNKNVDRKIMREVYTQLYEFNILENIENYKNDYIFVLPFDAPDYEKLSNEIEANYFYTKLTNTDASKLLVRGLTGKIIVDENDDMYYFNGSRFLEYRDKTGLVYAVLLGVAMEINRKMADPELWDKILKKIGSTKYKNEVFAEFKTKDGIFYNKIPWDSEKLTETMTMSDGVIDFSKRGEPFKRNGLFTEFRREYIAVNCTDVLSSGTPDNFNNFMDSVFPDRETLATARQAISLSISGETRYRRFQIWHGYGKNGKSTLVNILKNVIGSRAFTWDTRIMLRDGHDRSGGLTPEIAQFRGKLIGFGNETDRGRKISMGMAKTMTGGDIVSANPKYRDPINFYPTWQLILIVNDLPDFDGDDQAFIDRLLILPFTVKFADNQEDYDNYKSDGYEKIAWSKTPEELNLPIENEKPAILKQLIYDYIRLRDDLSGKIIVSDECIQHKQAYRDGNDDVAEFIKNYCVIEYRENCYTTSEKIIDEYRTFIDNHKLSAKYIISSILRHKKGLSRGIKTLDFNDPMTNTIIKKQCRVLLNIRLKNNNELGNQSW